MSSCLPRHPSEFAPVLWDYATKRPIIGGNTIAVTTGDVRSAGDAAAYEGPPSVDVVVSNLHEGSSSVMRAAIPLPIETVLAHVMRVVTERKLEVHTLVATKYALTLTLAHEFDEEGGWNEAARELVLGAWTAPVAPNK
jgi:hypothetical protein